MILSEILSNIGFNDKKIDQDFYSSRDVQKALLRIFYYAGYFQDSAIKDVLTRIRDNKVVELKNPARAFYDIKRVIVKSNANQPVLREFNVDYLLDNLFVNERIFDKEIIKRIIHQFAQNAFARKKGQERSDLEKQEWMDIYHDDYLSDVRILGLIEEMKLNSLNYDEIWILGAARVRLITRMKYLKHLEKIGLKANKTRLLTGSRELWLEIDSLDGDLEEAKKYFIDLAQENNIKFDESEKFVLENNKTYLNSYEMLTETMLAKRIFRDIFGYDIENVVDSSAAFGKNRPDTEKNAKDIALELEKYYENGEFDEKNPYRILLISNQPYCERQKNSNEIGVRKIFNFGEAIKFDVVGEVNETGIITLNSTLGALINSFLELSELKS